jgi:hypothetical protein
METTETLTPPLSRARGQTMTQPYVAPLYTIGIPEIAQGRSRKMGADGAGLIWLNIESGGDYVSR